MEGMERHDDHDMDGNPRYSMKPRNPISSKDRQTPQQRRSEQEARKAWQDMTNLNSSAYVRRTVTVPMNAGPDRSNWQSSSKDRQTPQLRRSEQQPEAGEGTSPDIPEA